MDLHKQYIDILKTVVNDDPIQRQSLLYHFRKQNPKVHENIVELLTLLKAEKHPNNICEQILKTQLDTTVKRKRHEEFYIDRKKVKFTEESIQNFKERITYYNNLRRLPLYEIFDYSIYHLKNENFEEIEFIKKLPFDLHINLESQNETLLKERNKCLKKLKKMNRFKNTKLNCYFLLTEKRKRVQLKYWIFYTIQENNVMVIHHIHIPPVRHLHFGYFENKEQQMKVDYRFHELIWSYIFKPIIEDIFNKIKSVIYDYVEYDKHTINYINILNNIGFEEVTHSRTTRNYSIFHSKSKRIFKFYGNVVDKRGYSSAIETSNENFYESFKLIDKYLISMNENYTWKWNNQSIDVKWVFLTNSYLRTIDFNQSNELITMIYDELNKIGFFNKIIENDDLNMFIVYQENRGKFKVLCYYILQDVYGHFIVYYMKFSPIIKSINNLSDFYVESFRNFLMRLTEKTRSRSTGIELYIYLSKGSDGIEHFENFGFDIDESHILGDFFKEIADKDDDYCDILDIDIFQIEKKITTQFLKTFQQLVFQESNIKIYHLLKENVKILKRALRSRFLKKYISKNLYSNLKILLTKLEDKWNYEPEQCNMMYLTVDDEIATVRGYKVMDYRKIKYIEAAGTLTLEKYRKKGYASKLLKMFYDITKNISDYIILYPVESAMYFWHIKQKFEFVVNSRWMIRISYPLFKESEPQKKNRELVKQKFSNIIKEKKFKYWISFSKIKSKK